MHYRYDDIFFPFHTTIAGIHRYYMTITCVRKFISSNEDRKRWWKDIFDRFVGNSVLSYKQLNLTGCILC